MPERLQRLFYGEGLGPGIHLADDGFTDDGEKFAVRARTNPFRPAGEMGEALFTAMYLTVKEWGGGTLIVTPFIDDSPLTESEYRIEIPIILGPPPLFELDTTPRIHTYEMPLVQAIRDRGDPSVVLGTVAPRGNRFSMLVQSYVGEGSPTALVPGKLEGELILEAPGVEYEVVREARAGRDVDALKTMAVIE